MDSKASLTEALHGSNAVFLVTTPPWGIEGSQAELEQGKNVADASKAVGVEHLIFSSLLNVTETSGGRLKHVSHFDQKAQIEEYIKSIGVPASFVLPGYFMTNYTQLGMMSKGEDGVYTLAYPVGKDAKFPLIDIATDMGEYQRILSFLIFFPWKRSLTSILRKIRRCIPEEPLQGPRFRGPGRGRLLHTRTDPRRFRSRDRTQGTIHPRGRGNIQGLPASSPGPGDA